MLNEWNLKKENEAANYISYYNRTNNDWVKLSISTAAHNIKRNTLVYGAYPTSSQDKTRSQKLVRAFLFVLSSWR